MSAASSNGESRECTGSEMVRLKGKIEDHITEALVFRVAAKYVREHRKLRGVRRIAERLPGFCRVLHAELVSGDYKPDPLTRKHIGGGGEKERDIMVPSIRDAIAAAVVVEVFRNFLDKRLFPDSYCNRRGRGLIALADKLRAHLRRDKPTYFVKCDIRRFFDSIRHADAERWAHRLVKCPRLRATILRLLLPRPGTPEAASGVGLPIGNGISHHCANWLLAGPLFRLARQKGVWRVFAYMDDVVFTGSNKRKLRRAQWLFAQDLADFGLTLKPGWALSRTSEGIDLVGFRTFPSGHRRLRRKIFYRARRAFGRRAASYLGWAMHAHDRDLYHTLKRRLTHARH